MLNITQKELERAFKKHNTFLNSQRDKANNSYKLILFYAVECGLKSLWMWEHKLNGTGKETGRGQKATGFLHNLNYLLKEMKWDRKILKAHTKNNEKVDHQNLHVAWRYGKQLEESSEIRCVEDLESIRCQLEKKIRSLRN